MSVNIGDKAYSTVQGLIESSKQKEINLGEKQIIVGQCPKSGEIIVNLASAITPAMKIWLFFNIEKRKHDTPAFNPITTKHWMDVKGYELQKRIALAIMAFLAKEEIETMLFITFADGEDVKVYSAWDEGYFNVGHNLEKPF